MVIQNKDRVVKSVSLPLEYNKRVNEYIDDFSKYVRNHIENDFFNIEKIDKEIKYLMERLNKLEKLRKEILNFDKNLTNKEKELLLDSSNIIKGNNKYFKPQHKRFMKITKKYIIEKEFKKLLEKYGN